LKHSVAHRRQERCCVLIPAFQEERRIAEVVRQALQYVRDIIVIDDGSSDRTVDEATRAGAVVLRHGANKGKGAALQTGFAYAREKGFDLVITMDADGQHDPATLPDFLEAYVRTGIPVLLGNRMGDQEHMPFVRRWTNRYMSWLLSRHLGQYVPDTQCGYRLYRCDAIPGVSSESTGYAAESEILLLMARKGVRIDSVRLAAIYNDSRSKIHPVRDTIRFFKMLRRYGRSRRGSARI
jgi:glycosyltransferase involved in cell wall biosynthesis